MCVGAQVWRILLGVKWRLSSVFLRSALNLTGGYISAPYLSVAAAVLFILGGDWWLLPGDRLSAGDVHGFLTMRGSLGVLNGSLGGWSAISSRCKHEREGGGIS